MAMEGDDGAKRTGDVVVENVILLDGVVHDVPRRAVDY